MKEIKILFFILLFLLTKISYSTENETFDGKGGRDDLSYMNVKNSNFKKGIDALNQAIKFEKKDKLKKASKRYNDAINFFLLARKENINNIEILNLLGFSYEKVNDFFMSEIYYKEGLSIDPDNNQINQKLGELYLNTKRISLAKERLKVLSTCSCEEYSNLKNNIASSK